MFWERMAIGASIAAITIMVGGIFAFAYLNFGLSGVFAVLSIVGLIYILGMIGEYVMGIYKQ